MFQSKSYHLIGGWRVGRASLKPKPWVQAVIWLGGDDEWVGLDQNEDFRGGVSMSLVSVFSKTEMVWEVEQVLHPSIHPASCLPSVSQIDSPRRHWDGKSGSHLLSWCRADFRTSWMLNHFKEAAVSSVCVSSVWCWKRGRGLLWV